MGGITVTRTSAPGVSPQQVGHPRGTLVLLVHIAYNQLKSPPGLSAISDEHCGFSSTTQFCQQDIILLGRPRYKLQDRSMIDVMIVIHEEGGVPGRTRVKKY